MKTNKNWIRVNAHWLSKGQITSVKDYDFLVGESISMYGVDVIDSNNQIYELSFETKEEQTTYLTKLLN